MNSILEIKKIEEIGLNLIKQAKEEAEALSTEADVKGRKGWDKIEEDVRPEIELLLKEGKAQIIDILKKGKSDKEKKIRKLKGIDKKLINQAAEIVLKEII